MIELSFLRELSLYYFNILPSSFENKRLCINYRNSLYWGTLKFCVVQQGTFESKRLRTAALSNYKSIQFCLYRNIDTSQTLKKCAFACVSYYMTMHPSREGGGRQMPNYKAITLIQSKTLVQGTWKTTLGINTPHTFHYISGIQIHLSLPRSLLANNFPSTEIKLVQ